MNKKAVPVTIDNIEFAGRLACYAMNPVAEYAKTVDYIDKYIAGAGGAALNSGYATFSDWKIVNDKYIEPKDFWPWLEEAFNAGKCAAVVDKEQT